MAKHYREEYIKYAKYIEEHYETSSTEFENLKGFLNILDSEIKALEENSIPVEKIDFQKNSIKANFCILCKKIEGDM